MKITLIGASGFVGTRLMDILRDKGHELLNIDKQQSHFFPDLTTIGNVLDKQKMLELLKDTDLVVLLAAEHRDDVSPASLYYDVNVNGMQHVLEAMEHNGVKRLIFFSSVAIYGLNKQNPDESFAADPFNHYGKSKWQAEQLLQNWYEKHKDWNINVVRPTVIFGERNRGNVYNLLSQISQGRFLMVGKGQNVKSMAYVGNVVAFVDFLIDTHKVAYQVYNYVDKPDFDMNTLLAVVGKVLGKRLSKVHFPYFLGMLGGWGFDLLSWLTGRKFSVSSVRVRKFCATTQYDASKMLASGFKAPYTLEEGLSRTLEFEFVHPRTDDITFKSE
ncbi:MAG: NAD-dependent epimerase/dehydratase family protein [Bacteroidales bacterium]|nr:NAD-dependent epimerase/dehydratase family protein [Bacteroidales bacterium]